MGSHAAIFRDPREAPWNSYGLEQVPCPQVLSATVHRPGRLVVGDLLPARLLPLRSRRSEQGPWSERAEVRRPCHTADRPGTPALFAQPSKFILVFELPPSCSLGRKVFKANLLSPSKDTQCLVSARTWLGAEHRCVLGPGRGRVGSCRPGYDLSLLIIQTRELPHSLSLCPDSSVRLTRMLAGRVRAPFIPLGRELPSRVLGLGLWTLTASVPVFIPPCPGPGGVSPAGRWHLSKRLLLFEA